MTHKNKFLLVVLLITVVSLDGGGKTLAQQRGKHVKSRISENHSEEAAPQPTQHDTLDWQLIKHSFSYAQGNAALSTFSVKFLLNMLYEGSGTGSQTQKELGQHIERSPNDNVAANHYLQTMKTLHNSPDQLLLTTRVFADEHFSVTQKYATTIDMVYNTSIESVNFGDPQAAADKINQWISQGTHGQIQDLVAPESIKNSVLLLTNTIYFKGLWENLFSEAATARRPFRTLNGQTVDVSFMKQMHDYYYSESRALNAKFLRLPFKGRKFSMILILPNEDTTLNQMLMQLTPEAVHQAIQDMDEVEVKVEIPKFRIEYTSSLKDHLQQIGINRIFQNNAELGGIARGGQMPVKVSDVVQKTVIVVDEKGSVASSASDTTLVFTILGEAETFVANRPFMFFIEEESTGAVLFAGKMENPAE